MPVSLGKGIACRDDVESGFRVALGPRAGERDCTLIVVAMPYSLMIFEVV